MNGTAASFSARDEGDARGHAAYRDRVAFERLLADLSARCANASHDGIVAEIEAALGRLVTFLGYDRCTYGEFAPDGSLNVLCSAALGGVEPVPLGPFGAGLPWFVNELRAGRVVAIANMPDELPPEAAAEAEYAVRIGLRSHLSIPRRIGGRVVGVLAFAGLRAARTWPEDVITRLGIIGDVFGSAVARAQSEDETQQLRTRLWHADRVARTGVLTAAIAHELSQPLTAILSNAQAGLAYLAQGRAEPEELRAILEAVVRDDKRAVDTIRSMRALLRRDEAGRARLDLVAALRTVLQVVASELRRQEIRVETDFGTGCSLMADPVQIEQVVLNLVLNAAAAMQARPRDERVLRLAVSRAETGRVVLMTVRDSGVGIAPEHLEAVFEPYWSTRREGLGLGLAICRAIVQAHGGVISVGPNPDRGVTFRVELPGDAAEGKPEPVSTPAAAGAAATPEVPAGAVCVVDDDTAVREGLVRLLAAAGFTVGSYASASEFIERASLVDAACIVLDNSMPGMSGLELLEDLAQRALAPPVVFVSGQDDAATGVQAMKLGAVDFLVKPVEHDVLLAAVRKALARRAEEQVLARERDACRTRVDRLSAREREILAHVIRGRLNKQIAADLGIAEQTVKQHRGRVMEKTGVRSVAELVRVCEISGRFQSDSPTRVAPK